MKRSILAAAIVLVLADPSPAQAQFYGGPAYRTSFGYNRGLGFSYQRRGVWIGGFAGGYSRSVFVSPLGFGGYGGYYSNYYAGGCSPWGGYAPWPYAPVMPAIAPITPFGIGPGFLQPGWGVGPTFGWNPVWGGALGWYGPPFWGGPWGSPYLSPFLGMGAPPILFGNAVNPGGNFAPNAAPQVALGGPPVRPPAAAPAPLIGERGFVVIEPKKEFPGPGGIAPDIARVAVPEPPARPVFKFDPFAPPVLVKMEKPDDDPVRELARLLKLGRAAFALAEYGTARDRFEEAIKANPRAAEPHFLKAQAAFATGNYGDAVASIRTGLALDPAWPGGAFDPKEPYGPNAATFALHLADLRKIVAVNPGESTLEFLLGYQLWFIGEKAEAKKWFTAAEKRLAAPGPLALFK